MIVSESIKLNIKPPFNNQDIELEFLKLGIEPLRCAIVNAADSYIELNVSYVKES